jgi:hypothetical protein
MLHSCCRYAFENFGALQISYNRFVPFFHTLRIDIYVYQHASITTLSQILHHFFSDWPHATMTFFHLQAWGLGRGALLQRGLRLPPIASTML